MSVICGYHGMETAVCTERASWAGDCRQHAPFAPGKTAPRLLPIPTSTVVSLAIGEPVSQNAGGHVLGHMRDLGFDASKPSSRGYQTSQKLSLKADVPAPFMPHGNPLFCHCVHSTVRRAQRFDDVPRLTKAQTRSSMLWMP